MVIPGRSPVACRKKTWEITTAYIFSGDCVALPYTYTRPSNFYIGIWNRHSKSSYTRDSTIISSRPQFVWFHCIWLGYTRNWSRPLAPRPNKCRYIGNLWGFSTDRPNVVWLGRVTKTCPFQRKLSDLCAIFYRCALAVYSTRHSGLILTPGPPILLVVVVRSIPR